MRAIEINEFKRGKDVKASLGLGRTPKDRADHLSSQLEKLGYSCETYDEDYGFRVVVDPGAKRMSIVVYVVTKPFKLSSAEVQPGDAFMLQNHRHTVFEMGEDPALVRTLISELDGGLNYDHELEKHRLEIEYLQRRKNIMDGHYGR